MPETDSSQPAGLAAAADAAHWQNAARIRHENPGWVVIWMSRARRYRAYPLFRAPRGTALAAATADDLTDQMDRVQQPACSPRQATGPGRQDKRL